MGLKILFTPSDNNLAGAFQSMVRLCVLLRDKHDCDVLVLLRRSGRGEELLKENGIRYLKIKSYNWIIPDRPSSLFRKAELCVRLLTKPFAQLYNQIAITRIIKLIREEKIDIVHQNTSYIYAPAKAALRSNVPLVWHLREFLEEDQHKKIWNRKSGYGLIAKASAVITISDSLYSKYDKLLKNANLLKIYNGIDASYYAAPPRVLFQNEKTNILMVGTINESKGQAHAIEACKRLVDKGFKDFIVTIVGDMTKYAQSLKDKAESLGIADYVKFVGLQKNTVKYYHHADIVLVCSRFEAFGRVTVEAMMGGCVVIGANTGGTVELIEDSKTGYLYESGNVDSLVKKIIYVLENKKIANEVAKSGQTYMLSNMTAEKNADAIYDVYRTLKPEEV
ncbi:MAG: glycosyltransferase family 4 protein [Oscillospiraceae bacterium]|nr:glycosyltransferase family 4 protein [Oscillospiraceae bacterium]